MFKQISKQKEALLKKDIRSNKNFFFVLDVVSLY